MPQIRCRAARQFFGGQNSTPHLDPLRIELFLPNDPHPAAPPSPAPASEGISVRGGEDGPGQTPRPFHWKPVPVFLSERNLSYPLFLISDCPAMLRLCSRPGNYFQAEARMEGNGTARSEFFSFGPAHPASPPVIGPHRADGFQPLGIWGATCFTGFSPCFCPKAGQPGLILRQQATFTPSKAASSLCFVTKQQCFVTEQL